MCEPNKPLPNSTGDGVAVTDEQAATLVALARDAALATVAEALTDVLRAALIDERTARLAAVAAVLAKYTTAPERGH